jgi:hypothetical protein
VSTWEMCGRAVAALLNLPVLPRDEYDTETVTLSRWTNKPLYVSSWALSQRDMLASVLRVWGDKESDWTVNYQPSEERYHEGRKLVATGGPDARKALAWLCMRGSSSQMATVITRLSMGWRMRL